MKIYANFLKLITSVLLVSLYSTSFANQPIPATPIAKPIVTNALNIIPTPPEVEAKGYLLMDANTGYIIAQKNANVPMPPASLTKLMTMYVISGILRDGRIHLTDQVPISDTAWHTGGSRMFVQVGTQVPVSDLINGIVVASGNDACVAMSEFIAGTESSFVSLMNKTAAQLGMKSTHYADVTGLPEPTNYTTPYDLSILTRAIINNYPEDYQWYSQKWMVYNNIKQPNRNLLLWRDPSVDGLKTGFTDDAGYCLVASAKRNDMRLIAVIMGSTSPKQRATDAEALLNFGFRFFETHKLYSKNASLVTLPVWLGKQKQINVGLAQDVRVTIPVGQYEKLQAVLTTASDLKAPIKKNQRLGLLTLTVDKQAVASYPLVALADNPAGGIFSQLIDRISLFFRHWFHTDQASPNAPKTKLA